MALPYNETESNNRRTQLRVRSALGGIVQLGVPKDHPLGNMFAVYCEKMECYREGVVFTYDGQVIDDQQTPRGLELRKYAILEVEIPSTAWICPDDGEEVDYE
eukprot:gene473-418_t